MRARRWVILAALAAACVPALHAAATPTVAFSDFIVNSDNPSYRFLGKGFAEIIAFELKKSSSLRIVDREKRNQILQEMEFSLSGATDEGSQLEMGKLLSVRYLVAGSITDMGGPLLVSLSMIDVQTGEIVWTDQVTASGGRYAYIGAYFGKSLLKYFNASVAKSTEGELAAKTEKSAASVVALSQGIAALDAGKKEEAKQKLAEAKKIDPTNAVAAAFLDKLAMGSAKFKVVPERWVPYFNPAYLGGMAKDRLYATSNQGWPTYGTNDSNNNQVINVDPTGAFGAGERRSGSALGYAAPVSPALGLALDANLAGEWNDSVVYHEPANGIYRQEGNDESRYNGLFASAGLAVSPQLSLGLGVSALSKDRTYYEWTLGLPYRENKTWSFGGLVAAAVKNEPGTLIWDAEASWSTERLFYFDTDPAVYTFVEYGAPIYGEQTLTLVLNGGRLFLALKQANDIYLDRSLYYGRVMPMAEWWLASFMSIRGGVEGSIVSRDGAAGYGLGGTAGLSVRFWKLELDANYTFRERPARTLADVIVPESVLFVTLSMNGLLKN